jgi:hypothetical protein
MEAAQRTLRPQMEARDLQEPGERINSVKESITCFELNRDRTRRRGCHCTQALAGICLDIQAYQRIRSPAPSSGRVCNRKPACMRLTGRLPNFLSIQPTAFVTVAFDHPNSRAARTNQRVRTTMQRSPSPRKSGSFDTSIPQPWTLDALCLRLAVFRS